MLHWIKDANFCENWLRFFFGRELVDARLLLCLTALLGACNIALILLYRPKTLKKKTCSNDHLLCLQDGTFFVGDKNFACKNWPDGHSALEHFLRWWSPRCETFYIASDVCACASALNPFFTGFSQYISCIPGEKIYKNLFFFIT